ncbi:uncharacterized protein BCR38DRAFT_498896 [Pseudomassariella vexata]|uniref:Uncharacterized protein n=1 Tax=Pseudomassariella vexata TaxID=1141098 RepID=A0A1Y2DIY1_9PEZI|nr:uncharacterized protein BCR38DRAFT_498896 [Pseudomassariella vexata]ORY59172.1 hypothetical protein BCR38DRAFT_498896 [Pseudomassariella vexata]
MCFTTSYHAAREHLRQLHDGCLCFVDHCANPIMPNEQALWRHLLSQPQIAREGGRFYCRWCDHHPDGKKILHNAHSHPYEHNYEHRLRSEQQVAANGSQNVSFVPCTGFQGVHMPPFAPGPDRSIGFAWWLFRLVSCPGFVTGHCGHLPASASDHIKDVEDRKNGARDDQNEVPLQPPYRCPPPPFSSIGLRR